MFGPADPHVTWEIAPGRLADGSVVEAWRTSSEVSWSVPEDGDAWLRHGRYRMFPFLSAEAADEGAPGLAFWDAVCNEWDLRLPVEALESRWLTQFNFFMLRAPLKHGGRYGAVSKTLVRKHVCARARTP